MTSRRRIVRNGQIRPSDALLQADCSERSSNRRTKITMPVLLVMCWLAGFAEAIEYANQWTVTIRGGNEAANDLAERHGFVHMGKLFEDEDVHMFIHHSVKKRSLRSSAEHHFKLISHEAVISAEQQIIKKRVKRYDTFDPSVGFEDPLWPKTWYLLPGTRPSMRVAEAWAAGYTGKNVVVTILDDGIEYTHPDLAANYDKLASKDINNNDDDPAPRPTYNNENRHGTRCAGEVAAVGNNKYCSAGIAYNAKIGGVRMLDGQVTDMVEGASIGLRQEHIDIFSASWGPDDDGRTVDGPAKRAKEAFKKGVTKGRGGKGSIFVWASGNGGRKDDNCNCDGYTNSIYTLSISSTTENTNKPWYSEDCSSTLATTYSSGVSAEKQIVTTDLSGKCTESHTGTSASAPLAAGICALALEANPDLTWRDMQHLVVRTANPEGLKAEDWSINGVGRKVSHSYGYGLMDAYGMATMAKKWVTVPQQRRCNLTVLPMTSNMEFSSDRPLRIPFNISDCEGVMPDRLEHVQAEISATSNKRGDMFMYLTSPMGTRSTLLDARRLDSHPGGFTKWPFMTTHSWDENPHGQWVLEMRTHPDHSGGKGTLTYLRLVLYGTLDSDWPGGLINTPTTTHTVQTSTTQKSTSSSTTKHQSITSSKTESSSPAWVTESTTGSCETHSKSGKFCLVCEDGYVRSRDKVQCLRKCPPGQYAALEKADEKIPRESTGETWEEQQEARFEEEERFEGTRVCNTCAAGPYCTECDGPTVWNCIKCVEGFVVTKGECVLESSSTQNQKIYALTISVCILSVIVFIFLFIFLQCCVSRTYPKTDYRYVPNSQDGDELNGDPFERPQLKYAYRSRPNGVTKGLLEDSDDERT